MPALIVAALLMVSVAHAAEEGDSGAQTPSSAAAAETPTPVPGQAPEAAAEPAATPDQAAAPGPAAQPPVGIAVSRAKASATKSVSIVDFAFKPASITVDLGDTVRWTNQDSAPEGHDVTGDGLDSGLMQQGDTYIHTFNSAGTVSYICTIHPSMKGTVKVLDRSSGGSRQGDEADAAEGDTATPVPAPPAGSEAAAVASPQAGGTDSSLPATGQDSLAFAAAGLGLLCLGLALQSLALAPRRR